MGLVWPEDESEVHLAFEATSLAVAASDFVNLLLQKLHEVGLSGFTGLFCVVQCLIPFVECHAWIGTVISLNPKP